MDVLRPAMVRIGNRWYRKNPVETKEEESYEEDDYADEPESAVYCDEVCDISINIEKTDNGYKLHFDVPSAYFKYIIGKKGETKKRLENETRTQIKIPKVGQEGDIVIQGQDRKGVLSAKTRIDVMVESARQKQPFTHFLSFPFVDDNITERLEEFKSDVLLNCAGDRGIDGSLFQNPKKLHLTLGTLALMNEAEINKASRLLHDCQQDLIEPVLKNIPLDCRLVGLEYMNDDPSSVDVLYAKIELTDNSDRLQILADRIVERFISEGLMQRQHDRVKLHVTVMNTLFRKDPSGATVPTGGRNSAKDRESFDARNVLQVFGEYDFGDFHIGQLHLSQRYSTHSSGYYSHAAKVQLP